MEDEVSRQETRSPINAHRTYTTDLENFQDLTQWCQLMPKKPEDMSLSIENDELNTPVIEFGEFLFTSPETIETSTKDRNDLLNVYPLTNTDVYKQQTDILNSKNDAIENTLFRSERLVKTENAKMNIQLPYSNIDLSDGGGVDRQDQTNRSYEYENINNYNIRFSEIFQKNVNSDSNAQAPSGLSIKREEPSESAVANPSPVGRKRKELRLDFSNILDGPKNEVIDTPEVINTALSLENGFNLASFIEEDGIRLEEVSIDIAEPSSFEQTQCNTDTSDEDYEPPWKQRKSDPKPRKPNAKPTSKSYEYRESCDSEMSNASDYVKSVKRGRPPKRNVSFSSESNADTEVSRYRELRDKNNEASRRSRLNRKMKDLQLEQEARDLDVRNRKLKVRVTELEKLVHTMRDNLMHMLIKN